PFPRPQNQWNADLQDERRFKTRNCFSPLSTPRSLSKPLQSTIFSQGFFSALFAPSAVSQALIRTYAASSVLSAFQSFSGPRNALKKRKKFKVISRPFAVLS
ncbi:hypothetical protein, partial [Geoalkalibacter ferrihydriticus]|uniref:hypothetical protein n=1 Tax=Geoalkalibacter ferrihydriticus TaxID=392333 RepID=UPI001ABFF058